MILLLYGFLECITYITNLVTVRTHVWQSSLMSPACCRCVCGRCAARIFKFGFSQKEICTSKIEQRSVMCRESPRLSRKGRVRVRLEGVIGGIYAP